MKKSKVYLKKNSLAFFPLLEFLSNADNDGNNNSREMFYNQEKLR